MTPSSGDSTRVMIEPLELWALGRYPSSGRERTRGFEVLRLQIEEEKEGNPAGLEWTADLCSFPANHLDCREQERCHAGRMLGLLDSVLGSWCLRFSASGGQST